MITVLYIWFVLKGHGMVSTRDTAEAILAAESGKAVYAVQCPQEQRKVCPAYHLGWVDAGYSLAQHHESSPEMETFIGPECKIEVLEIRQPPLPPKVLVPKEPAKDQP